MKTINLEWKEFKINGKMVEADLNILVPTILGVSENANYQVHCADDISEEDEQAIRDHWDAITEESEEATSWKSKEDRAAEAKAEVAAKKASGKAKLIALGFTEEEATAVVGA